jgi:hypothetical protein
MNDKAYNEPLRTTFSISALLICNFNVLRRFIKNVFPAVWMGSPTTVGFK